MPERRSVRAVLWMPVYATRTALSNLASLIRRVVARLTGR